LCEALLQALKVPDGSLSVVFVGTQTMRSLNARYRQKDYATDVLSFSYGEELVDHVRLLGEIVVAPEIAVRQARLCRARPEWELRKLLAHGVLHLLGYDHEADQGQMQYLQNKLVRRKFFLEAPPIGKWMENV
jgi:probable rRNA maturation factor